MKYLLATVALLATLNHGAYAAPPTPSDWDYLDVSKEAMTRLGEVSETVLSTCGKEALVFTVSCTQALDTSAANLYIIKRAFASVTPPDCFLASQDKMNAVIRAYSDAFPLLRDAVTKYDVSAMKAGSQLLDDGKRYFKEAVALAPKAEGPPPNTCFPK